MDIETMKLAVSVGLPFLTLLVTALVTLQWRMFAGLKTEIKELRDQSVGREVFTARHELLERHFDDVLRPVLSELARLKNGIYDNLASRVSALETKVAIQERNMCGDE